MSPAESMDGDTLWKSWICSWPQSELEMHRMLQARLCRHWSWEFGPFHPAKHIPMKLRQREGEGVWIVLLKRGLAEFFLGNSSVCFDNRGNESLGCLFCPESLLYKNLWEQRLCVQVKTQSIHYCQLYRSPKLWRMLDCMHGDFWSRG